MIYLKLNSSLMEAIRKQEKLLSVVFLCIVIFLVWSWAYNILSLSAWDTPVGYQGDGWMALGFAKAYLNGEISPFVYQYVPTLNAPFFANWNDYAVTEDFVFASMGWLGRLIGLFPATNFILLLAHLMAGVTFWYVCRHLKYDSVFSIAGAIVYAFSHYIMARGLGHLVLSYFWHIPLLLLLVSWLFSRDRIPLKSNKFVAAVAISAICGLFNPYYTGMYLQFLGFGLLLHLVRRDFQKSTIALILIVVTFAAFFSMNANTILYGLENEVNSVTGARNLASLEVYGLKIPELLLTPGNHPWTSFVNFSRQNYYGVSFVRGEYWSPYLGIVSIIGLFLLLGISFYRLLQGKLQLIPLQFWLVIWILMYSLIGGLNLLLGVVGIEYFRATNRYSIFILTICLLFLIKFLSRNCPKILIYPVALAMVLVALTEELHGRYSNPPPAINPITLEVVSDKNFALSVERQMPNSMVFQLPVADFPEIGPIHEMGDYEHLRPYLYTKTLHYSYGTNKGRGDTDWQVEVASLTPNEMAKKLEAFGFGVIILNRKGYIDGGRSLIEELVTHGKQVIAENKDLVAVRLTPSVSPEAIESWLTFSSGWSDDEGTHRWSESSDSKISIVNNASYARPFILTLKLSALTPRIVNVSIDNETIDAIDLSETGVEKTLPNTEIILPPGKTTLNFSSDERPVSPGNGDRRLLSFKLRDFSFESKESFNKRKDNDAITVPFSEMPISDSTGHKATIRAEFPRNSDGPLVYFAAGWSADEITHRWSESRHASIIVTNDRNESHPYTLEFMMTTITPRQIKIKVGTQDLEDIDLVSPFETVKYERSGIILPPGKSVLSFDTDSYPVSPGNKDTRKLSFQISKFKISPENN